ncbi:MAG: site-specific DNA-methyltransferase [Bacteroidales bacterium]|jgi:DNA modification methylase|nr:site-specific DNA-methyltransferase [Bacteroidales bacterium]
MIKLNTIQQGDCLELIKKLPDASIDCIVADPPYFLGVTHNGQKGEYSDLVIMKPFFESLFFQMNRVLKKDGCLYLCCDFRTYPLLYHTAQEYMKIDNLLVWDKWHGRVQHYYWLSHELIMFHGKLKKCDISMKNVFTVKGFNSGATKTNGAKLHPTQKPVELFEKFILDSTSENNIVLDCFFGSGTTAIAAIKTNRNYIGFELQGKYCKIAQDRINRYRGEEKEIENYEQSQNLFFQQK